MSEREVPTAGAYGKSVRILTSSYGLPCAGNVIAQCSAERIPEHWRSCPTAQLPCRNSVAQPVALLTPAEAGAAVACKAATQRRGTEAPAPPQHTVSNAAADAASQRLI